MPKTLDAADELSLHHYVRIVQRRWRWFAACCAVMVAASAVWSVVEPPRYCSSAQVLIADSQAQVAIQGTSNVGVANRDLANELSVAQSDTVRFQVVASLGGIDPEIDLSGEPDSDIIRFHACGSGAEEAALYANTWADSYVTVKQEQASGAIAEAVTGLELRLTELRDQRAVVRQPLDELEGQLARAGAEDRAALASDISRLTEELKVELQLLDAQIQTIADNITVLQLDSALALTGTARVIQEAAPPLAPASGTLPRNLTLGLLAGLLLGALAVLVVDNLDRTIKSAEDLAGLPVLGVIPKASRGLDQADLPLATMNHDGTAVAEAYQKIRSAVEFSLLGRKIESLLITSPNPSEGKTTTSCNLAWALSALDHRVVLADVDFRRPRLHQVFGCAPEPGLSDHLLSGAALNQLALRVDDSRRNMVIIPTGGQPPNPADFVASSHFAGLVDRLQAESDLVVLDAPPVLPVSDALAIARLVDAVIVVAKAGSTTHDELRTTVESLESVGADILGICLVGVNQENDRYGDYGAQANGRRKSQTDTANRDVIDLRDTGGSLQPTQKLTGHR